jgi:hypothetical protein
MFVHLRRLFTTRSRTAGNRPSRKHRRRRPPRPALEALEDRCLLSGAVPAYVVDHAALPANAFGTPGYSPALIRHAYGIDQVAFGGVAGDGHGQTIAIIDAYDDPNIGYDLHQFDLAFGLPDPPGFQRVSQTGSANYPTPDPTWATEIALDVEWAHALAPAANILLVEAADNNFTNLFAAVTFAKQQPGVSVVSMSFSGGDFPGENYFDSVFTSLPGHGVTFLASTGDSGAPSGYPATSPGVIAVGGTSLALASGGYASESGWSGSGGGLSPYEAQPAYQHGVVTQSGSLRGVPDVAFDADPNTGVPVYDSYNTGGSPWLQVGGTSLATPAWAALVAVADQGRALLGLGSLDGPTQTLPLLYSLPATDFHDVVAGSNGYPAGPGYDLVTGRGTPAADRLVRDLAGFSARPLYYAAPAGGVNVIGLTVAGGYVEVFNNNTLVAAQPVSLTTAVTVVGNPYAVNQVYAAATAPGIATTIGLATGSDFVAVNGGAGAEGILGALMVQGPAGARLYVDDRGDPAGRAVAVTGSGISGLAPAAIGYAGISTLAVIGGGQPNRFTITGSPGAVYLYGTSGADVVSVAVPAGAVYASGHPGDTAYLFGGPGGNILSAVATSVTLSGPGYLDSVGGFGTVASYADTAADVAIFRGAPAGSNTFVAYGPAYAYVHGPGYLDVAYSFLHSYAYAAVSSDVAYFLAPAAGTNWFAANGSAYAFLNGYGYSDVSFGFARALAVAGSPLDVAYFYGPTAGPNGFTAQGAAATWLSGSGFTDAAFGFGRSFAYAGTTSDAAVFQGSAAGTNDFAASGTAYAFMNGPGYSDVAFGFGAASATAGTASDVAYLADGAGATTFQGQGASASLTGTGFAYTASGFSVVNLSATQTGVKTRRVGAITYVLNTSGIWQ